VLIGHYPLNVGAYSRRDEATEGVSLIIHRPKPKGPALREKTDPGLREPRGSMHCPDPRKLGGRYQKSGRGLSKSCLVTAVSSFVFEHYLCQVNTRAILTFGTATLPALPSFAQHAR
jgi:hypothetical protein